MTDASFAPLSPRLLARKGGAKPAMRSQLGMLGAAAKGCAEADLEDLGWNDLGEEGGVAPATMPLPPAQSAEVIAIASTRARPNVSGSGTADVAERSGSARPGSQSRSIRSKADRLAFTLRLDPERHLKLRLACTVRHCSAQQLVTDALDALLAEMPDIQNLAAQLGRA